MKEKQMKQRGSTKSKVHSLKRLIKLTNLCQESRGKANKGQINTKWNEKGAYE